MILDDLDAYRHLAKINRGIGWVRLGESESPFRWLAGQPGFPVYIVSLFPGQSKDCHSDLGLVFLSGLLCLSLGRLLGCTLAAFLRLWGIFACFRFRI